MKRLFLALLILLMASPLLAQEQVARMNVGIIGGGVVAAAAGCTTDNDVLLDGNIAGTPAGSANDFINCTQVSISATSTITGYTVNSCDNGADTGNIRLCLFTNNSAPTPDNPTANGMVTGSDVSLASSAITNCPTYQTQFVPLATPLTGVTSGLYWICSYEENAANQGIGYLSSGGDLICQATNVAMGGISCTADYRFQLDVYGCAE